MNDKDLRKLSRSELLEMLLEQSKEVDRLQEQLKQAQAQIESRTLAVNEAGSIAEAALKVNRIFEAAQMAADQYLDNVHQLTQRQNEVCAQLEAESKAKADKMISDAEYKCRTLESETETKCKQMLDRAESDSKAYWIEVSSKLEMFWQQHAGLKELLSFSMPK